MLPVNPTFENLTPEVVAKTIDHALLRPDMTTQDVISGCQLCAQYKTASVCVRPSDVSLAAKELKDTGVLVGTVIGFPHGTTTTQAKVAESLQALDDGAVELDMVINIGRLKSNDINYVRNDIAAVVQASKKRLSQCCIKVILECCLLTDDEKIKACGAAQDAGADYVKTSTGFSAGGATLEDLRLMRQCTDPSRVRVKASGGVRSLDELIACLQAGADRIGASATAAIVDEMRSRKQSQ
ncbi:hypothetical protein J3B02_000326 [Coemansia erecta]|uniref:deoxyribose-phosphate aldolase n=1 Tax=Coemansia asiatica TaxID=1052880 RepID=A0A9W7XH33_9FUNG|nr:hypothetical protein LPJ64_005740 [Coemansia asiatica]KAJ2858354.1 hypothetical protein J3B02_000326 [Coemansia erecta]KAJ2881529.1 hypothetical protein FB639_002598 [Coemansia asiatica]